MGNRRSGARLRIGVDASRAFGPEPTGTERYATHVIRGLVEAGRHDYRLYLREAPSAAVPPGAEQCVLRAPRFWTHTRLAFEVTRRPPDVLFVPAHVLPWRAGRVPSVVTVHDLGYLAHPDTHTRAQRAYLHWTTRRHAARATRIVADSRATRDDLVRWYGADPARVAVVHLGVDAGMRRADPQTVARVREALGLAADRRYVLHVGTLQPRKNLARLVDAFASVAARVPNVDLVLAGKQGWGGEDLAAHGRSLGLAPERLRLVGYVPRTDLPGLYTGAAACVVPSLYEGFGLTALEAMACGAPVAVSNVSSLPEVVGYAAPTFDPLAVDQIASVLLALLRDDHRARAVGAAGAARARGFSWRRCARGVQAVLEDAAGGHVP